MGYSPLERVQGPALGPSTTKNNKCPIGLAKLCEMETGKNEP